MKKRKVFILGDIGLDEKGGFHFGDEAMFFANLKWYEKQGFEVLGSSRLISHACTFTESLDIYIKSFIQYYLLLLSAFTYKFLGINFLPDFFRNTFNDLIGCDRLHISGGGNLNEFWYGHILYRSLMINIASLYKVPVYISGQTIGNISNSILKSILSDALKKVEIIGIRDKNQSLENLLSLGVNKDKILFCPDDLLLLEHKGTLENNLGKVNIGLSLHKFEEEREGKNKIVNILRDLNNNIPNIHFFLIPHYYNKLSRDDDLEYMKNIFAVLKIKNYVTLTYTELMENKSFAYQVDVLFQKYHQMDLVISTRYHGVVSSLMQGVPVVAINLNDYYNQKNNTFYNEIGLDSKLFQYDLENGDLKNFSENCKNILSKKETPTNQILLGIKKLKEIQNEFYDKIM